MGSRTALATLVALVLATTKADEASSAAARAALLRRKGLELYAPQHQIEMVPGTAPVPGTNETARLLVTRRANVHQALAKPHAKRRLDRARGERPALHVVPDATLLSRTPRKSLANEALEVQRRLIEKLVM